ncbi:MAG TPA: hypothetical protein VGF06_00065 [Terriglobales bacterium]
MEVFSSTGGLLRLSKPIIQGTRIKVMFVTPRGTVFGAAEMLSPISWTKQPFRFVALPGGEQSRLQDATGSKMKPETSIAAQVEPGIDTHHSQWIEKYRDAITRNPPPRPLLRRLLDAIASIRG